MRKVEIGMDRFTEVMCLDEPGAGGACHEYAVKPKEFGDDQPENFAIVDFQNGAIEEAGVNGCHNEDLIAIVMDRLQHFQKGDFCCRENATALTHLEEALFWLNKRTNERIERGVEGTLVK